MVVSNDFGVGKFNQNIYKYLYIQIHIMAHKTFNINEKVHKEYSKFCKENGINMSKQIEFFMQAQIAKTKKERDKYLDKLKATRRGQFTDDSFIEELIEKIQGKL